MARQRDGGREGERDDLAGEQRVDEAAGAALAGVRPPRGKVAVALGDDAQGRFVFGCEWPHASLLFSLRDADRHKLPNLIALCRRQSQE